MLEKILKLEGVGLFATPLAKAVELKQATLIYADNGRGKSTLSAVMRACAAADAQAMAARATIGGTGVARAQFRFKLPTGGTNVTFDDGVWDAAMPNLMVFDQAFIERNVYAGSEVQADHHQSLLDFALGTAAVAKKKEVDDAHEAMTAATKARSAAEGKLQGDRGTMSVTAFLALPEELQADELIAEKWLFKPYVKSCRFPKQGGPAWRLNAEKSLAPLCRKRFGSLTAKVHTLVCVMFPKCSLYWMKPSISLQSFDGQNVVTVMHHCQRQAGFHGGTVHMDLAVD